MSQQSPPADRNPEQVIVKESRAKPNAGKVPVIELFGPTIQGEGMMSGTISHFLRTGGCPLKCDWCDSMYAVDPRQVKENAQWMNDMELLGAIGSLPWAPWITFTGGDPCIWEELGDIIIPLNAINDMRVAVETQGTLFPEWLHSVDTMTFSPKPPSSGNTVDIDNLLHFLRSIPNQEASRRVCIKVVVFNDQDFEYALDVYRRIPFNAYGAFYFTAGTPLTTVTSRGEGAEFKARSVLRSMRRLANQVLIPPKGNLPYNHKVHIGSQLHVLLWPGEEKGV